MAAWLLAAAMPIAATATPAIRLDVPAIRQAPERCGPAALSMVLRYYGATGTALAEPDKAYDRTLRGALITDLAAAARRAGYEASVATPPEDSLRALLAEGVPPILLYERSVGPLGRAHYGVISGWQPASDSYVVLDGGSRPRLIPRESLLHWWRALGGQALIVRRP